MCTETIPACSHMAIKADRAAVQSEGFGLGTKKRRDPWARAIDGGCDFSDRAYGLDPRKAPK